MKKILDYLKEYFTWVDKRVFLFSTFFTAVIIFCNYFFGLNKAIYHLPVLWQYPAWYAVFFFAFAFGYWLQFRFLKGSFFLTKNFLLLLVIAPAIFSWKMAYRLDFKFSSDVFKNEYWNAVVYWPFKVLVVTSVLLLVHKFFDKDQSSYGTTTKNLRVKPYLIMLLLMIPLIGAASTQQDFLRMYPRMQQIEYLLQPGKSLNMLLYQLSYGSDFFTIELFFRGFLILAFARFAGKGVILPMAIFYCTIHFGKPLGECVSSYFGGIVLGIVSYHTRTILGGLVVHIGIAWLMELGGYIGNLYL